MPANKAPGLDGLPSEFHVAFFNNIVEILIESYNFSFCKGLLSQSQRYRVITLVPKGDKDPLDVSLSHYVLFAKRLTINLIRAVLFNRYENTRICNSAVARNTCWSADRQAEHSEPDYGTIWVNPVNNIKM